MRLSAFLTACGIALTLLAGCGDSGSGSGSSSGSSAGTSTVPDQSPGTGRTQVAIVSNGTGDYWNALHAGAIKAQMETAQPPGNKPVIDILWRDPMSQDDSQAQIRTVEDLLGQHVAAIILAPSDPDMLKDVVERAAAKRIPVIIIDTPLNSTQPRSFIGTDEKHGGDSAGQYLGKILGGKGKIIVLHAQPGTINAAARESGFLAALKEQPALSLIPSDRDGGATSDTAYSASKRLLTPYINADGSTSIDGIFAPTESTTQGMLRALVELKLAGKVKFVGYGAADDLIKGLGSGAIDGLVLTRPMNIGHLAVKAAIDAIKEKKIEPRYDSGTIIATRENLASPETQEILHPDLTALNK